MVSALLAPASEAERLSLLERFGNHGWLDVGVDGAAVQPGRFGPGSPVVVSWTFGLGPSPDAQGAAWRELDATQKGNIRLAFAEWQRASGLVFVEVPPTDAGDRDPRDGGWDRAVGNGPDLVVHLETIVDGQDIAGQANFPGLGARIWFNLDNQAESTFERNTFGFLLALHEIGHAIGFKHPFEEPSVLTEGLSETVMSYDESRLPDRLGRIDLATVAQLYGAPGTGFEVTVDPGGRVVTQAGRATDDLLRGTPVRDVMQGYGGNDLLQGGAGDDELAGGPGQDELLGGSGDDRLFGTGDGDVLDGGTIGPTPFDFIGELNVADYGRARTGLRFSETVDPETGLSGFQVGRLDGQPGGAGGLRDQVRAVTTLLGTWFEDVFELGPIGSFEDRPVVGGGEAGDRYVAGNEAWLAQIVEVQGASGRDVLRLEWSATVDLVFGLGGIEDLELPLGGIARGTEAANGIRGDRFSIEAAGRAGDDRLQGSVAADRLYGGAGADRLEGWTGQDQLWGGAGDDVLRGGPGPDRLWGGPGADRFELRVASHSGAQAPWRDRIGDFAQGEGDRIDLSGIDANPLLAGDQGFVFVGGAAFTGPGQLRSTDVAGGRLLLGNLDDDPQAEFSLAVEGAGSLTALGLFL